MLPSTRQPFVGRLCKTPSVLVFEDCVYVTLDSVHQPFVGKSHNIAIDRTNRFDFVSPKV